MPLRDGTGPPGVGAGRGRGLGWCLDERSRPTTGGTLFGALLLSLGAVALRDLKREDSALRRLWGNAVSLVKGSSKGLLSGELGTRHILKRQSPRVLEEVQREGGEVTEELRGE